MTSRFIIAASPITAEEASKVTALFVNKHAWWHWIDSNWLVVDRTNTLTVNSIRDDVKEAAPNANVIVLQIVGNVTWAGFGPIAPQRDMFDWIKGTWMQD